jgi:hypothetical protein
METLREPGEETPAQHPGAGDVPGDQPVFVDRRPGTLAAEGE